MITVADILEQKGSQVWSVDESASVGDVVELMSVKNIGAVPILGVGAKPVGIITERDISRALLKEREKLLKLPVTAVMTKVVQCVPKTTTVLEAMAVMTRKRFRHLPVCDRDSLAGIISIGDVVKSEIHEKEIVIDQLENYISGSL